MNKKYFNGKQFYQTFKQLKTVGIIFSVILAIGMIMIPVSSAISINNQMSVYGQELNLPFVTDVSSGGILLFITFVLYTPILALMCWNYMTKRNSSDFYQSLPYTRTCTFFTHVAAIVAWQMVTLVIAGVSSAVTYAILSKYFIIDYGTLVQMYMVILGCNLLCASSITIACTLTGSVFSNICVSGLIIFMPRLLIKVISITSASIVPVLSSDHIISFLGNDYNVLTESVFTAFGMGSSNISSLLISKNGFIYMIIVSIIYFAVAAILFKRRRSEAAGKGAYSRLAQTVIRIVIGFGIGYFGMLCILGELKAGNIGINVILPLVICFIVASLVVMCYESINIKNIRGSLNSIPSIIIALILSVIAGEATLAMLNNAEKYSPTAESIDSIVMTELRNNFRYESYENYFEDCASKIENDNIEKIFCEALRDNVETYSKDNDYYSYYRYKENKIGYTVCFIDGIKKTYRDIYLDKSQVEKVVKELQNNTNYKEAMLNLPSADEASISITDNYNKLSDKEVKEIYNTMLEESKEVSFIDWYNIINSGYFDKGFEITFTRNGKMYSASLPFDERMPKTYKKYIKKSNEANYNQNISENVVKFLRNFINGSDIQSSSTYVNIEVYNSVNKTSDFMDLSSYIFSYTNSKEIIEQMCNSINDKYNGDIDLSKPYVILHYSEYQDSGKGYGDYKEFSIYLQSDLMKSVNKAI